MRIDRRQFIQAGAIVVFAGAGCGPSSNPKTTTTPPPAGTSASGGPPLEINFEGLYLIERKGTSMIVHLIDGPAVGLPAHLPQMSALASTIDQTKTAKPDAAHIIPAGSGDDHWLWDLKGVDVSGPAAAAGANGLTANQTSSEDSLDMPTDDAGWDSMARVPDLHVLLGATKITNRSALTSSVTLTNGHLAVQKPTDPAGNAVWVFTNPATGNVIMRRALSNLVSYSCPMNGAEVTMRVGTQSIVFKPGTAVVSLTNKPVPIKNSSTAMNSGCGNPCTPRMDHFAAFAKLVDAQFTPTVAAAGPLPSVTMDEAGADYCPGGTI
jgi:hypothetical protein